MLLFKEENMARPKKPEERNRIRDVAFCVFSKKGYEKASFSDIAKEASVSKSLVQYYFPKKEQFVNDFINKSLSTVAEIVREDLDITYEHELGELYAIGYLQFYFAMCNDTMNALKCDILRDRAITEMVVKHGITWLIDNSNAIQVETPEEISACKKTLVFVVGGAFDYIYDAILYGVPFDIEFLSDAAMKLLNPFLKEEFHEGASIRNQISDEWMEEAKKKYNRRLFSLW